MDDTPSLAERMAAGSADNIEAALGRLHEP
jgi:hypothetical protein